MESYIAENIMREYNRKKRYQEKREWTEMQKFIKENCMDCKNRNTNICEIRRNIEGQLKCQFKEI